MTDSIKSTSEEKVESAVELILNGYTCSEAVLMPYAKDCGLDMEVASKISGGFAGGMSLGKTCGAVTGAVMVLGLKYGPGESKEQFDRDLCSQVTQEFFHRFAERRKTTVCGEILQNNGINMENPEEMATLAEKGLCDKIVKDAAEIIEDILADDKFKK